MYMFQLKRSIINRRMSVHRDKTCNKIILRNHKINTPNNKTSIKYMLKGLLIITIKDISEEKSFILFRRGIHSVKK
jgi:hypothetical protein